MTSETMIRTDWGEASERLNGAHPREILRWAVETFYPRLTMATAFGPEGCVDPPHALGDRAARAGLQPRHRLPVPRDAGAARPDRRALRDRGRAGPPRDDASPSTRRSTAGRSTSTNPDQCCYDRKIVPLRRAVEGYDAWISSIRADQSSHRAKATVVGWDAKFDLVKINPLLSWTQRDVWAFVVANNVPYNPLHDQGYPVDRLLALHPAGRPGRATSAPAAGPARPRPSAACTRSTAASFDLRRPTDRAVGTWVPADRRPCSGFIDVKISAKAEYACLAMLALARHGPDDPPVRIREISEAHGIPERYLVQILLQLKGAGLVASTRGAAGGYRLARPATSISLGEVLTAIDGPDAPPRRVARARRPGARHRLGPRPRRRARRARPDLDRPARRTDATTRVGDLNEISRLVTRSPCRMTSSYSSRSADTPGSYLPSTRKESDDFRDHSRIAAVGLNTPYGGTLVDLLVDDARAAEMKATAKDYASLTLDERGLCDLELLAVGGFSPLKGFLGKADYERVVAEMRLADGTLWPLPVTLPVTPGDGVAEGKTAGPPRRLRQPAGVPPRRGDLRLRQGGRGPGRLRLDRRQAPVRRLPRTASPATTPPAGSR